MSFKKTLIATAAAAVMATSASAQDIAVIGASIEDAFWNLVKKGLDDATEMVEANGGTVNYLRVPNYDNFGPDLVSLVDQAIAQGVDGIASPVWIPEAQLPALQRAADMGIVITLFNAGEDHIEELGALNYFGSDEYVAGVAGGKYLAEQGAEHILCHIQIPGATNLESRCEGVSDGASEAGAKVTVLRVPANLDGDVTGTAEAIKAELIGDESIDAVINLAAWASDAATNAVSQIGGSQMVGTFDLSPAVLDRIAAGTQVMAIDQQPYLQGYLATSTLFAHLAFGTEIVTQPVLTGPAIIDASNIDSALAGVALGAR